MSKKKNKDIPKINYGQVMQMVYALDQKMQQITGILSQLAFNTDVLTNHLTIKGIIDQEEVVAYASVRKKEIDEERRKEMEKKGADALKANEPVDRPNVELVTESDEVNQNSPMDSVNNEEPETPEM